MAGRSGIHQSLTAWGSTAEASHIGLCASFIEEDQTIEVYRGRLLSPRLSLLDDVGPILLTGVERFF